MKGLKCMYVIFLVLILAPAALRVKRNETSAATAAAMSCSELWILNFGGSYGCFCGKAVENFGNANQCNDILDGIDTCCFRHKNCYEYAAEDGTTESECDERFKHCLSTACLSDRVTILEQKM